MSTDVRWTQSQNSSHSNLSQQGLEIAIPPGDPSPSLPEYGNTTHLPLPPSPLKQEHQPHELQVEGINVSNGATEEIQAQGGNSEGPRPTIRFKSNSSPSTFPQPLPPPPKPPMTKSRQKILQITGHDMRYDRSLPEERSEFLVSDDSSGSESDGSEGGHIVNDERSNDSNKASTLSNPPPIDMTLHGGSGGVNYDRATPLKSSRFHMTNIQEIPQFRKGVARTYSTEPVTIKDFIKETQGSFPSVEHEAPKSNIQRPTDVSDTHSMVPKPLTTRPKKEPTSPKTKRSSILAEARDSMAWGIQEITGAPITRSKELAIPENLAMPPPPEKRKRNFGTSKHPLKSPFPFRKNSADSQESDTTLGKRFSGAMKRLSGGRSPTKTTIISTAKRAPDGPDTPMPVKSVGMKTALASVNVSESVQHGNEHLQEVYEKAKKSLKIKTSDERRRESLKKKIVVVGIIDQSPGTVIPSCEPQSSDGCNVILISNCEQMVE